MSRFSEIETFVAVVETGSFTAASKRMGIAVSAISRRVGELESRLGVRLANRSTRGFAPTAIGQEYYGRCLRILADLAEADAGATGEAAALSGLVRIAAPLSFGVRQLGPALHAYARQRPLLNFDVDLSDRRVDIIEEGFDLAIRIGKLEDSSLIAKKLFPVRHIVAASPAFWDKYGRPKTPHDLEGLPALNYRIGADPALWHFRGANGKQGKVRISARYTVTNGDFATEGAVDGLGMVLEPTFICGDDVRAGRLEPVLLTYCWFDMAAYAVWPPGRPLPERARQLIDYLAQTFAEPTPWDAGLKL